MVLVDTSVWIRHFKSGDNQLRQLLMQAQVLSHPFVIGELSCGHLKNRKEILSLLAELPQSQLLEDSEILLFIENRKLMGLGIGLVDVHLLASALLSQVSLWTLDNKLKKVAQKFGMDF